jgi:hypothetical protein
MMKNKCFRAVACLFASLLAAPPVMALSEMGRYGQQINGDTATAGDVWESHPSQASSLHQFLPDLIGPRLYLHLLQSDEYVALEGVMNVWWEKHIIKKQ